MNSMNRTIVCLAVFMIVAVTTKADEHTFPGGTTNFLEGAFQMGRVMQTNEFVEGENASGEPIDSYRAAFLRFGWQTDGSRDWHHLYNFPAYGLALYGLDYGNTEELGNPTSLYGFFVWPMGTWGRTSLNADIGFGLTTNWEAYDRDNNPYNTAMGLGRSVHIDFGANVEYRLAEHWAGSLGFSVTHFSNGGTRAPNSGMNQIGPYLKVKYKFDDWVRPVRRTEFEPFDPEWDLNFTLSGGTRSINHNVADIAPEIDHVIEDYFMGNLVTTVGYRTGLRSRWVAGLDLGYNESADDVAWLAAAKEGENIEPSEADRWELGVVGGYEQIVHRTVILIQLGYNIIYKDVDGALPSFYQRLGIHYDVHAGWHLGLNVRLSDFSRAQNLEWGLGKRFGL